MIFHRRVACRTRRPVVTNHLLSKNGWIASVPPHQKRTFSRTQGEHLMRCLNHPEHDAVAQCNGCLTALCKGCAEVFTPPSCANCASSHNKSVARSFYKTLGLMGLLFISSLIMALQSMPLEGALVVSIGAGFFPAGWSFLSRYFSPSGDYMFPMMRWFNLSAHFAFSALLGFILGPIYLYKSWRELSTIRTTKRVLAENADQQT